MSNHLPTVFKYDPTTGVIKRHGKPLSTKGNAEGYLRLCYMYTQMYQHQLAFFLMEGRWPLEIDHIDGNKGNNKWSNLREVTRSQNEMNKKSLGITKRPHGWWEVRVQKDGVCTSQKHKCLGQALKAVKELKQLLHGEYTYV